MTGLAQKSNFIARTNNIKFMKTIRLHSAASPNYQLLVATVKREFQVLDFDQYNKQKGKSQ